MYDIDKLIDKLIVKNFKIKTEGRVNQLLFLDSNIDVFMGSLKKLLTKSFKRCKQVVGFQTELIEIG